MVRYFQFTRTRTRDKKITHKNQEGPTLKSQVALHSSSPRSNWTHSSVIIAGLPRELFATTLLACILNSCDDTFYKRPLYPKRIHSKAFLSTARIHWNIYSKISIGQEWKKSSLVSVTAPTRWWSILSRPSHGGWRCWAKIGVKFSLDSPQ